MKNLSPEQRQREIDAVMERVARRATTIPNWRKTKIRNWGDDGLANEVRELRAGPWWKKRDPLMLGDSAEVEESGRVAALATESLRRREAGEPSRLHEISAAQHEGEDDDVDAELYPRDDESIGDYFARLGKSIDFNDPAEKFFIDGLRSFASRFRGDARAVLLDRKVLTAFLKHARTRRAA